MTTPDPTLPNDDHPGPTPHQQSDPQPEPPAHPDQDAPQTVVALLRQLGLTHAPAQHQIDAIRTWLADHPPNPALRISLLTNGYGLLLRYHQ